MKDYRAYINRHPPLRDQILANLGGAYYLIFQKSEMEGGAYYLKKYRIFAFKYSANLKIFACGAPIRGALINSRFSDSEFWGALINLTFQNSELEGGA